jgi:arginine decarboxylase
MAVSPRDAFFAPRRAVALADCAGRVCAETVCPYPPGIPVAFPGGVIRDDALRYIRAVLAAGGRVTATDPSCATLQVLDDNELR